MLSSLVHLLPLLLCVSGAEPTQGPRVAVVGGGIGGTSVAFFISQRLKGANITLVEMGEVGGRLDIRLSQKNKIKANCFGKILVNARHLRYNVIHGPIF